MMSTNAMPPLGIEPRYLWDERRLLNLGAAIKRYHEAGLPVPVDWLEEYEELFQRDRARQAGR